MPDSAQLPEEFIERPADLARCCEHLRSCPAIGFDTEFIGEHTFVPELCLIQVSTPDRLYVIDPLAVGQLDAFWQVLAHPERVVVAHAAREEVRICERSCGQAPGRLFDLQIAAGLAGVGYPMGHGPLVQALLGVKVHKGETLTDWKMRPLTTKQVRYAFDDVRYLLPLWQDLSNRLESFGRGDWVSEEIASFVPRSLGDEPGVERWRKLKGIGGLDRKRLAVVRALHQWREQKALSRNRPARTVIRDDLIAETARRLPRTVSDLEVMRGLAKKDLGEILMVVNQARSLAADDWPDAMPRDDDPPQVGLVSAVLYAVLSDWCSRQSLSPALVASASDVKTVVRAHYRSEPLPENLPLRSGWRSRTALQELQAVLEGRRRISVESLAREAPFLVEERRIEQPRQPSDLSPESSPARNQESPP